MSTRPPPGVANPVLAFLTSESAGGALLIAASVIGLAWANSAWAPAYVAMEHWHPFDGPLDVHAWVNDGLMAVFFLLVGLELRREIAFGELSSRAQIAAPAFGALGGMVVPAMIFFAFNAGRGDVTRGWAIPIATDIAFALAVAGALGRRVPIALKVFLTALAIIDDLGAILVIAFFYTKNLDYRLLGMAAVVLAMIYGLARYGERRLSRYLVAGVVLWMLVFGSGVHATLAGVALALVVPLRARPTETEAPAIRLEHGLHPWVSFVVLPVFGLVNAGLDFSKLPTGAATNGLVLGVGLGLLAGKQIGVFGGVMLAVRAGLARLPEGCSALQLYGVSVLCGIGFTMSLFIADLAFGEGLKYELATLAIFGASLASALLGLVVLAVARTGSARD